MTILSMVGLYAVSSLLPLIVRLLGRGHLSIRISNLFPLTLVASGRILSSPTPLPLEKIHLQRSPMVGLSYWLVTLFFYLNAVFFLLILSKGPARRDPQGRSQTAF